MKQLTPGRQMPILPAYIHSAPRVTIERLATALYRIGRFALSGAAGASEREASTLALISQIAEAALEDDRWNVPTDASPSSPSPRFPQS